MTDHAKKNKGKFYSNSGVISRFSDLSQKLRDYLDFKGLDGENLREEERHRKKLVGEGREMLKQICNQQVVKLHHAVMRLLVAAIVMRTSHTITLVNAANDRVMTCYFEGADDAKEGANYVVYFSSNYKAQSFQIDVLDCKSPLSSNRADDDHETMEFLKLVEIKRDARRQLERAEEITIPQLLCLIYNPELSHHGNHGFKRFERSSENSQGT